jgi:hypothetical protein
MPKYRRGSGSVYRRGKTYWIGYYDPRTGKQVCESAKTADKAEARRILQARLGQLAEGRYTGPAAERVTFEELATMILDDYRANGQKSVGDVEWRIRCHLRPFFGHKKAHDITTADVKAYIARRQAPKTAVSTGNWQHSSACLTWPYKQRRLPGSLISPR